MLQQASNLWKEQIQDQEWETNAEIHLVKLNASCLKIIVFHSNQRHHTVANQMTSTIALLAIVFTLCIEKWNLSKSSKVKSSMGSIHSETLFQTPTTTTQPPNRWDKISSSTKMKTQFKSPLSKITLLCNWSLVEILLWIILHLKNEILVEPLPSTKEMQL